MRVNTVSKIAIAGAAASLCLAPAAPALAHDTGSGSDPAKTNSTPTLAQQKAWIDAYVTRSRQGLAAFAAKVAADPKLTAAQKADWANKIAAKQSALTASRDAVDAATTADAVHAAVTSAMRADGVHGFGGWRGLFGADHWRDGAAKAGAHKPGSSSKPVVHGSDPGSATKPAGQTVTLRASKQTVQGQNGEGKHWDGQSRAGSGGYQGRHGLGGGSAAGSSSHGGHGHDNGGSHHR